MSERDLAFDMVMLVNIYVSDENLTLPRCTCTVYFAKCYHEHYS